MLYTIQNDFLKADINTVGAELSSLSSKQTGTEYLWHGDPAWWAGRAPILFPIVCSLKDGVYTYNGVTYSMPKHGFVRGAEFTVALIQDGKIIFEYSDNEETRKMYPFSFLFQVTFELVDNQLIVIYRVINRSDVAIYFSIGAHEAYRCPREDGESFDDYYLEFETDDTYISETVTPAGLISGERYMVIEGDKTLPLKHELFANDALIIKDVPSSRVSLKSKKSRAVVEINYHDAPHLGIWTKVGAPYICIEPWYGLPDEVGHDGRIEDKLGIVSLGAGREFVWPHDIKIHEN